MFGWFKPKKAGRNDDTVRLCDNREDEQRDSGDDSRRSYNDGQHYNRNPHKQSQTVKEYSAKKEYAEPNDSLARSSQRKYKGLTFKGALIWSIVLTAIDFLVFCGVERYFSEIYFSENIRLLLFYSEFFISIFICSLFGLYVFAHGDRIKFVIVFVVFNFLVSPLLSAIYMLSITGDGSYFEVLFFNGGYLLELTGRLEDVQYLIYRAVFLYFSLLVSSKIIRNKR